MKQKALLLAILLATGTNLFSQTQQAVIKDPSWKVVAMFDSRYGTTLSLPSNNVAMIISTEKSDFSIVDMNDKLAEQWNTPLKGYPLAMGKYKGKILVIAATEKTFFKTFTGSYKAYLLDEKTGKQLSEKIIYDGNPEFIEQPDFFFAPDGSYFRMTVRLTSMKRKGNILGFSPSDKNYRLTQGYSIINYDEQFNLKQRTEPAFPNGRSYTTSNGTDGSLFIAAVDDEGGVINASTYLSNSNSPLKTISVPLDLRKGSNVKSIFSIAGAKPLTNYLAIIYTNKDKETTLLTLKLNFADGSVLSEKEVFDGKHEKMLVKSFQPANKKFDDLQFSKLEFLGLTHMEEFGDRLLVSVSPSFFESNGKIAATFDGSVLINVYDEALKPVYHQFIPRTYMSVSGEGSKVSYQLNSNTLRMIANMRSGSFSGVSSLYAEMDFKTGQVLAINKIPDSDIKSGFYVNTESVSWLNGSCILPYFDKQRILRTTRDVQIQLVGYK